MTLQKFHVRTSFSFLLFHRRNEINLYAKLTCMLESIVYIRVATNLPFLREKTKIKVNIRLTTDENKNSFEDDELNKVILNP